VDGGNRAPPRAVGSRNGLDREERRGHLAAHSRSMRGEINEKIVRAFSEVQVPNDKSRQAMAGPRQQAHVRPRIHILFYGEKRDVMRGDAAAELGAIAIAIPLNAAEQVAIVRA
jgi:hypothetical protein